MNLKTALLLLAGCVSAYPRPNTAPLYNDPRFIQKLPIGFDKNDHADLNSRYNYGYLNLYSKADDFYDEPDDPSDYPWEDNGNEIQEANNFYSDDYDSEVYPGANYQGNNYLPQEYQANDYDNDYGASDYQDNEYQADYPQTNGYKPMPYYDENSYYDYDIPTQKKSISPSQKILEDLRKLRNIREKEKNHQTEGLENQLHLVAGDVEKKSVSTTTTPISTPSTSFSTSTTSPVPTTSNSIKMNKIDDGQKEVALLRPHVAPKYKIDNKVDSNVNQLKNLLKSAHTQKSSSKVIRPHLVS